jgi:Niemann-Pick C1 protein
LYDTAPSGEGTINRFFRKYYAPFILRQGVKQLILGAFGGIFVLAIIGIQQINLGLGKPLIFSANIRPTLGSPS